MKIAQLTQPLHSNYGGILQAYALQAVLCGMGHEVVCLNRTWEKREAVLSKLTFLRVLSMLKCVCKRHLSRQKNIGINNPFLSDYNIDPRPCLENLRVFEKKNIKRSKPLYTSEALGRYVMSGHFDAIIVGSDQVWRKAYSPCITDYFLTFLPYDAKIKRVAYAASIGIEEWDIEDDLLSVCGKGLKAFDAISVREVSGRELLSDTFGLQSMVLLDPTMLLTQEDWCKQINKADKGKPAGLVTYVLDESEEKTAIVNDVAKTLRLRQNALSVAPLTDKGKIRKLDSISTWLAHFANAQFVVTDSFHGCVFSILFNKPFVAIANKDRGLSRFTTLLGHFSLQSRLVFSFKEYETRRGELLKDMDYEAVNRRLDGMRMVSRQFLRDALGSKNVILEFI